jgi:hypothetical protein
MARTGNVFLATLVEHVACLGGVERGDTVGWWSGIRHWEFRVLESRRWRTTAAF